MGAGNIISNIVFLSKSKCNTGSEVLIYKLFQKQFVDLISERLLKPPYKTL